MNFHSGKKHVIDLIFPIALFFVFAVSALVVILLAADSYRSSSNRSEERCQTRICLSYISEKIRQNDDGGNIFSGSPEDRDSLIIRQEIDGIGYTTYIYEYEGMLKELFIRDGVSFLPENGRDLIKISDFSVEELSENLFRFTAVSESGSDDSVTIGTRSHHGEDET